MQLTNTGSVPAVIAYTVTPEANGCSGGSITYTIVVNPIPGLSPIAAEVICGGTSFTAPVFTSTVSGTSYTWTLDQPGNVPATLTGYQLSGSGALPSQQSTIVAIRHTHWITLLLPQRMDVSVYQKYFLSR